MSGTKIRIGEVHALLRSEFPDIELSKIRYYEDKGLVRPERSRKGYRLYSESDIQCLREAFRLAQEEFVPLRVVRQRLIEQGLLDDAPAAPVTRRAAKEAVSNIVTMPVRTPIEDPAPLGRPAMSVVGTDRDAGSPDPFAPNTAMSRMEFMAATTVSDEELIELEYYGFVSTRDVAGQSVFSARDCEVVASVCTLLRRGVQIRHLQPIKRTVDRQMDLICDVTTPLRQRRELSSAEVLAATRDVARDIDGLRAALLARSQSEYFGL